jgi:peptidoglycan/xylan/chitin deacetylase (PgdA/CDA1 family)
VPKRFQPLVLCYHAVSDSWAHLLAVTPRAFERQIRSIRFRGYRPVTAAEAVSGGRVFHVTFDDAYKSVMNAVPTLERLGVPATVFACASFADDGRPLAVPELAAEADVRPDALATMDWERLRDLADRNVEIGSHTLTHPHLTQLSDAELDRELRESRERIEA